MLERFKNYDMDEKLIIITCIAMYLPFYIGFAFLAFNLYSHQHDSLIELLKNGDKEKAEKELKRDIQSFMQL